MHYVVCQEPGRFQLLEKEIPKRKKGEALVRIRRVGICGTDLHAYSGNQAYFTYPRILGHELSGTILEIEKNNYGLKAGEEVLIMPYKSCGKCIACKNGKTNCCTSIQVLGVHQDGGMQEIISIPTNLLIPSGQLSLETAAIVEPLAIGAHAIRRAGGLDNNYILVVGCGPIGIGIMKLAQYAGAKVIAMDVNDSRLEYVHKNMWIKDIIHAGPKALDHLRAITNGDLATVVFDATGNKKALESGIVYMAHGGRYVLVGLSNGEISFNHPSIHAKESTIMCSRNATLEDFEGVIEYLQKNIFPVDKYITHKIRFSEILDHFDGWTNPDSGVIKAMVEF